MRSIALFLLTLLPAFAKAPTLQPFIDTYVRRHDLNEVKMIELDSLPTVVPVTGIEYPVELRGTGVVGRVGVMASIKEDGSVHWVIATFGNDVRFRDPVLRAVRGWRYSIPLKDKKPVASYVRFRVVLSEKGQVKVTLERKEPPAPPLAADSANGAPTPAAVNH